MRGGHVGIGADVFIFGFDACFVSGASIRSLIIKALQQIYTEPKKGHYVTGPLVTGPDKLGPAFHEDENPTISFFPNLKVWLAYLI